jgi:hypothetical protein
MAMENKDINQMVEDATAELETKTYATRGQTRYIRAALIRIFRLSPEDRATFKPKNGWEEMAVAHFNRCLLTKGGTAALNALRESLGESVSKQKEDSSKEKKPAFSTTIVDDLPRAEKQALN